MGSLDSSSQCYTVKFTLRNLQHQHSRFPILHQLWGLFVYDLGAGFYFFRVYACNGNSDNKG